MRKKTYQVEVRWTDSRGHETIVVLFTPAKDVKEAIKSVQTSSEFGDWDIISVEHIEGIILWRGKTQ